MPAQPAKLLVGAIMKNRSLLETVAAGLMSAFGPLGMVSPWYAFNDTDYYAGEMGQPLFRRIIVFKSLVNQDDLVRVKLQTNALEKALSVMGARQVNLDPGFLVSERFVLASGKNFTHRIYLGQGIYADLTLIFERGAYRALPWTYPDYASSRLQAFLLKARGRYRRDLKEGARAKRLAAASGAEQPKRADQGAAS